MANQNAAQLIDDIWMTGREDIILVPTGKSGGFMVRPGDFGTYGAYMVRELHNPFCIRDGGNAPAVPAGEKTALCENSLPGALPHRAGLGHDCLRPRYRRF